jgi:hypothetical protein
LLLIFHAREGGHVARQRHLSASGDGSAEIDT